MHSMVDVALDRRPMKGLAVPLPVESLGLAMAPFSEHMEPLPVSRPLEHSVMDIKMVIDKLDDGPLFGSDRGWSCLEITDTMRREALRIRSTGRISDDTSGCSLILSPEQDSVCEEEMSLDEVSSEGLRQWNMDMDVEYQYETFNGLQVYYGGDMYNRRPPDGDEARNVDTVDMVPMCRTVAGVTRTAPDDSRRSGRTPRN